jgi:hypothetical protein
LGLLLCHHYLAHAIVEDEGPQKSGSEYEPQANEGYEEEEVSKV